VLLLQGRWPILSLVAPSVIVLATAGWWFGLTPRNDRNWASDVARLPTVRFAGSRFTVDHVRDFVWRSDTDVDETWETRTYDLDAVDGVDLFISYWGPQLYAHTIASWAFADGRHLAISIETRKEKGESYSALLGFFRRYELYYVVADERDVIGVRAAVRGERVFLYQLGASRRVARDLLRSYLERINELAAAPAWYNALTHNCTTVIGDHVDAVVTGGLVWDWRILANGRLDQLAYERRIVNTGLPFAALRERSDITVRAIAAHAAADFSSRIREGLLERPYREEAPPNAG
jgi:hypothetical protein